MAIHALLLALVAPTFASVFPRQSGSTVTVDLTNTTTNYVNGGALYLIVQSEALTDGTVTVFVTIPSVTVTVYMPSSSSSSSRSSSTTATATSTRRLAVRYGDWWDMWH